MNRATLVCCDWAFVHCITGNVKDPAENGFRLELRSENLFRQPPSRGLGRQSKSSQQRGQDLRRGAVALRA